MQIQTMASLEQSEAHFREILETWNQGFTVRRDDKFLFVNQAFADMCGYESPAAVLSLDSILTTFREREHERILRFPTGRDTRGETPTCYEIHAVRKDGSEWWAENRVQEITWEGEPAFLTAVNDITARKRAEQALKENEQRFRDFAETASDWFWETDHACRFAYFSGRDDAVIDELKQSALGKTRHDLRPSDDTDNEKWIAHRDELDARRPFRNFEYARETADGVKHTMRISGKPIFSDDGAFLGYRGTSTDITEQTTAERDLRKLNAELERRVEDRTRELAEKTALLEATFESISEGFALFDSDDRLVFCNKSYTRFAEPIADLIEPGVAFETLLRAMIEGGHAAHPGNTVDDKVRRRLRRHREPSGNYEARLGDDRWMLITERRTENGGIALVVTDITELKGREEALRQSRAEADRAFGLLMDAMESASDGVALFDADDRLVVFNERFRALNHEIADVLCRGAAFEELFTRSQEQGYIVRHASGEGAAIQDVETRMALHRNPRDDLEVLRPDGRWIGISERRMRGGGIAMVQNDITERKQHEEIMRREEKRFFNSDGEATTDNELLELLLLFGLPGRDVRLLATRLINCFGNFSEVIGAEPNLIREVSGDDPTVVTILKIVEAATRRALRGRVIDRPMLESWDALLDYCRASMRHNRTEQFRIIFVNHKNILIADEVLQTGTVDQTTIYPREVVRRALDLGASGIIMVHNHPSGDPTPSKADREITNQVVEAGRALGITVHDHLVIAKNGYNSFKSLGLL